jgi:asparagine synthase (glutamine-hydrolysing)
VLGFPSSAGVFGKAQRYIRRSNQGNPERYCQWHLLQHFSPDQVLSPEMFSNNGSTDFLSVPRALHRAAPAHSELNRLLYIDAHMTLADNDLPKVVRASEMAGVTVRFPYLDHVLAEFSGKLPIDLKVRWLEKRYLFKRATRNLLPQEILKKKKHGFGLPIGGWLRTIPKLRRMTEEVLFDARTYQRGYFKRTFIEQMFREMDQDTTTYMGDLLWLFLMLELWHRGHVEGSAV